MDNFETYLYLALAVIYIISRILKARKQSPPQQQQRAPQQQQRAPQHQRPQQRTQMTETKKQPKPRKAFSFDDILREFEKNLAGEDFEEEKALPVEEINYEKETHYPTTEPEKALNPYESFEGTTYESPKIAERKEQSEVFSRSEKYNIKEDIVNNYKEMLQDPEGFKNAIVLSEIINRKYF